MRKFRFQFLHPSWHFYALVWGIIFSIIFDTLLNCNFASSILWLAVAVILIFFAFSCPCRLTLTFALISGLLIGGFRMSPILDSASYLQNLVGKSLTLSGKISDDPVSNATGTTLKLTNVQFPDYDAPALSGVIYVQLSGGQLDLEKSDLIALEGKLANGFGTFAASMYRPKLISIDRSETGNIFSRLKHWFASIVQQYIPSPEGELGLGYLVGMKSNLPESLLAALQIVGMTHVIVASGAHLGILTSAAQKLFGKISKFASLLFSLLLILAFVCIVGFTPSMTRAGLVASLSLMMGYIGRKFTPLRLLSFVAAITLLIEPSYFMNLGWQLSFASFFAILIFAPRLQRTLYGGKKPPWLANMLITSISTSLTCAPILIYNFGSISFLSLIVNLIILPTLPYAMLLVFLTGITSFLPFLAQCFGFLATILLKIHILVVNFFSEKTMFVLDFPETNFYIFLIYFPILLYLIYPRLKQFLRRFLHLAKNKKLLYNENNES